MNKKIKEHLRAAFDTPNPVRKNAFIQSLNFPKATRTAFVLTQIKYIRKWVWFVMLLAAVPSLTLLHAQIAAYEWHFVWVASALLPFITLAGITEVARSVTHALSELEASCRYNFSDVVLARLGILGCVNAAVFAAVIAPFSRLGMLSMLRMGTCLFVPFLLTCALSLFVLNRLRSKDSVYGCGAIACFVSIGSMLLSNQYRVVFSDAYLLFWGTAFCVLLGWTTKELIKFIRRTEEIPWNWSLTA